MLSHQPFYGGDSQLSTSLQFLNGVGAIGIDGGKRDKQVWEIYCHLNCILIGDVLEGEREEGREREGGRDGGRERGRGGRGGVCVWRSHGERKLTIVPHISHHGGLIHVSRAVLLMKLVEWQQTQRPRAIPTLSESNLKPSPQNQYLAFTLKLASYKV